MTIRLLEPSSYKEPLDEWPVPAEPALMASREFERLSDDLRRYVRGDIRGRSYLIAGHRGVGKTSLAIHAVEAIARKMLTDTVREQAGLPAGPIERPLLVKLEGPSMLEEQQIPVAKLPPKPPEKAGAAKADDENGAGLGAGDGTVAAGAHAALVQITIGLYRALAREAATGYRAHAALLRDKVPHDQGERAAQLALDLDGGVEPVRLRGFWKALGRLKGGVFWPKSADETLLMHRMRDQGLREIIALATAAQAFQVCTGRISYTSKTKDSLLRTRIVEMKGSSDLRDAISRLTTLGLGALTGVSILGATNAGGAAAISGGLAVWLLGTLSLSWSDKRTRTNDRSVDYSFIRDSSLATLGRDLPVVIARVREAGLAPVFIIDELDKVEDAPKALAALIGKLKHLIADYGFFCFLVNRDAYEAIEARVRSLSYPAEHTLFGERILVRPDPAFMLDYLLGLTGFDPAEVRSGQARATFALVAMHEARLNLTDLSRFLGRYRRGEGTQVETIEILTSQRKLVIASVQLAIGLMLESRILADRMAEDPIFAQLALDTLYYPSRQWQKGGSVIDSSRDDLKSYLIDRMKQELAEPGEAAAADKPFPLGDEDLNRLHGSLIELLRLLADLPGLQAKLGTRNASGKEGEPEPGDIRLAEIVPGDVPAICSHKKGVFEFLFTPEGDARGVTDYLPEERRKRIAFLTEYCTEFLALLRDCHTSLDELAATPLIKTVASASVRAALAALGITLRTGQPDRDMLQHLSVLERLFKDVTGKGEGVAKILILTASLHREAEATSPVLPRIARLIRFDQRPKSWFLGHEKHLIERLPKTLPGIKRWREQLFGSLYPVGSNSGGGIARYLDIAAPLRAFWGAPGQRPMMTSDYGMLVDALRDRLPAAALSSDLSQMTARDWSRLALSSFPVEGAKEAPAPYWMLVAGLRGLGFGRDALMKLADVDEEIVQSLRRSGWTIEAEGMSETVCLSIALEFASGAPQKRDGIVAEVGPDDSFGDGRSNERVPMLILDAVTAEDYIPLIAWLYALGILELRAAGLDKAETE